MDNRNETITFLVTRGEDLIAVASQRILVRPSLHPTMLRIRGKDLVEIPDEDDDEKFTFTSPDIQEGKAFTFNVCFENELRDPAKATGTLVWEASDGSKGSLPVAGESQATLTVVVPLGALKEDAFRVRIRLLKGATEVMACLENLFFRRAKGLPESLQIRDPVSGGEIPTFDCTVAKDFVLVPYVSAQFA